jgi:hypothetical protein
VWFRSAAPEVRPHCIREATRPLNVRYALIPVLPVPPTSHEASSLSSVFASFRFARVEPFSEPHVDWGEQFPSLLRLALVAPETRHAHGRTQLPGFCLLRTRNRECALEIRFCFGHIRWWRDLSAISPAMRWNSASHHPTLLASAVVIASRIQRQASSNCPTPAWAIARCDRDVGTINVCRAR